MVCNKNYETSYKSGHVTYYFKENRMPFIVLNKNYETTIKNWLIGKTIKNP
jgi:hypothetical protein